MSTNDFGKYWGEEVSQDDDMGMFIDSEDDSECDSEEPFMNLDVDPSTLSGKNCEKSHGDEDPEVLLKEDKEFDDQFDCEPHHFQVYEKEVTNGLEDDGWLYQEDGDGVDVEDISDEDADVDEDPFYGWCDDGLEDDADEEADNDEEFFNDLDLSDIEITDEVAEELEKIVKGLEESQNVDAVEKDKSEMISRLFVDDTGNTCYDPTSQKSGSHESAIETYMKLVRKNLSKEEASDILYGNGSITDCLVKLFGKAVLREVLSDGSIL